MDSGTSIFKQWKLHLTILVCCMISDKIGNISIPITAVIKVTLLPLLYAMVLVTVLYLIKPVKWIGFDQTPVGGFMMSMSCIILLAKLGVSVGTQIETIMTAGLPLLIQNIGGGFTCVLALPVALLLGLKRESVGLTFANSREGGMALMEGKYGAESAEFRGVVGMYVIGTVFGTIVIGTTASIMATTGIFHPYSVAMAVGCGSAAMSTAGIGTMTALYPAMAEEITAFATASNLISSAISTYLSLLIGIPLANFMYKKLYPVLSKDGRAERKAEKGAAK